MLGYYVQNFLKGSQLQVSGVTGTCTWLCNSFIFHGFLSISFLALYYTCPSWTRNISIYKLTAWRNKFNDRVFQFLIDYTEVLRWYTFWIWQREINLATSSALTSHASVTYVCYVSSGSLIDWHGFIELYRGWLVSRVYFVDLDLGISFVGILYVVEKSGTVVD